MYRPTTRRSIILKFHNFPFSACPQSICTPLH